LEQLSLQQTLSKKNRNHCRYALPSEARALRKYIEKNKVEREDIWGKRGFLDNLKCG